MPTNPIELPLASRRRTKIVATLGPASRNRETIDELIQAGVNVFRLNMSHSGHEQHRSACTIVREAATRADEPIALLADLCGPKIRVGTFPDGEVELTDDATVCVTTREVEGSANLIPCQYQELAGDVKPKDRILLDDGMLELRVESVDRTEITCTVVHGGPLKSRKGMNLPGVDVSTPALTDKDKADVRFALEMDVDYFALSFVRRAADVADLRAYLDSLDTKKPIIAKIEKPEALEQLDEILVASDGVMVARGDLGVELAPEQVPLVQQDLILRARKYNKPVIVATQMLESMIDNPRPTRAEVSDVSTAVLAGADAVMLSAETSIGEHPVKAVAMMDRIARYMEAWLEQQSDFQLLTESEAQHTIPYPLETAVARSMAQLSRDLCVKAVAVRSKRGTSVLAVAGSRPGAPIISMSTNEAVCRRLSLLWGVVPCCISEEDFTNPEKTARTLAKHLRLVAEGDVVLLLAGFGIQEPKITVLPG